MKRISCFVLALLLIVSFSGCDFFDYFKDIFDYFKVFETSELGQYGTYTNPKYAPKGFSADSYITPIFPEKIEDFFLVQKYSYKYCIEPPMIEAFLEIVIEDEAIFQNYVNSLATGKTVTEFPYEEHFKQIVFSEVAEFHHLGQIGYTDIRKILFSDKTNTIIFSVIEMPYNEGPLKLENFSYFTRFAFDMTEYAYVLDSYPGPYEDLKKKNS